MCGVRMTIAVFYNLLFRLLDKCYCSKLYVRQWFSLAFEIKELSCVISVQIREGTPGGSQTFLVLGSLWVCEGSGYLYKHQ